MTKDTEHDRNTWVGLIGFVILVWALHAASSVILPLALAAFIVVLVWPLEVRLERRLSGGLSIAVTVAALLTVFAALGAVLWVCVGQLTAKTGEYHHMFESFMARLGAAIQRYNLPNFQNHFKPTQLIDLGMKLAGTFAVGSYQFIGSAVLVLAFVVLLLIEAKPFARRMEKRLEKKQAKQWLELIQEITVNIHRFMLTRTLTSAITGMLTGLFTWIIGLDFPLVWAVLAFILNYVPVLGSIVAVIPPTLVALIQPDSLWLTPMTLGGLTVIQFTVGNYLDPLLQGRNLSLPPLVVFYAIVFWGWVWGIAGALLGVPLTVAIVSTCRYFEKSRWLAQVLMREQD